MEKRSRTSTNRTRPGERGNTLKYSLTNGCFYSVHLPLSSRYCGCTYCDHNTAGTVHGPAPAVCVVLSGSSLSRLIEARLNVPPLGYETSESPHSPVYVYYIVVVFYPKNKQSVKLQIFCLSNDCIWNSNRRPVALKARASR